MPDLLPPVLLGVVPREDRKKVSLPIFLQTPNYISPLDCVVVPVPPLLPSHDVYPAPQHRHPRAVPPLVHGAHLAPLVPAGVEALNLVGVLGGGVPPTEDVDGAVQHARRAARSGKQKMICLFMRCGIEGSVAVAGSNPGAVLPFSRNNWNCTNFYTISPINFFT